MNIVDGAGGRGVGAVRGGNLKKKTSWSGVGGEGAAPPPHGAHYFISPRKQPPDIQTQVTATPVAVRGGNLQMKKMWRGVWGEGAAPPPQM